MFLVYVHVYLNVLFMLCLCYVYGLQYGWTTVHQPHLRFEYVIMDALHWIVMDL